DQGKNGGDHQDARGPVDAGARVDEEEGEQRPQLDQQLEGGFGLSASGVSLALLAHAQDTASLRGTAWATGSGRRCFCRSRTCHQKNSAVTGMTMKILKRIQISMPVNTRLSALMCASAKPRRTASLAIAVARK